MPSTAESRRRREPLNSCSRTKAERQVYSLWTGYRRKLTLAVHRLKHPYPCASRTSPSAGQPRPPLCSGIAHGTNPPRALSQNGYGRSVRLERANLKGLVLGCIEAKFYFGRLKSCKKICVGKPSPRSTQCTPLHRSQCSKFYSKIAENITNFSPNLMKFC